MLPYKSLRTLVTLAVLSLRLAQAQLVENLPQCVQDCIDQSPDTNCALTDIRCICRASAGNFLPDVVTCVHGNCDNELDTNLLLAPLQLACMIAGSPIPASAIRNAENQASSLASQVTTTVTMGGSSTNGGAGATTTVYAPSVSVSTVTVTTIQSGSTIYQVFPITKDSTTTISGPGSTLTSISTAKPANEHTGVIPVIIVSTNSQGSTYTSTTTRRGAISTYTTTDSRGSTTTQMSTFTMMTTVSTSSSAASLSTNSVVSTASISFTTTSVAAGYTSSSETASSKTANAPSPDSTNSSPFKNTNSGASKLTASWLGLVILLVVVL